MKQSLSRSSWPSRSAAHPRGFGRLGYDEVDARPALELFRALAKYVSALLARDPALMKRRIRLRDSDSSEPYAISVEGILARELDHAREHLVLAH